MACYPCEPQLSQVLDDPVTRALMASDGVDLSALRRLLDEAKQRIAKAEARARPSRR
jgi:hypothetical protein